MSHARLFTGLTDAQTERFWTKVTRGGVDSCWLWTAYVGGDGYGHFSVVGSSPWPAHRVAYELVVGPVETETLDHLCRNRSCVNPAHLEPVSHRINLLRGETLAASHAAKTHCKRGHEFTPENIYQRGHQRHCRACRRAAGRRYAARRSA